jgi:hypothetical protein
MRNGLTKGLAASAVGALALTGLAVGLPAGLATAAGPGVAFLSLYNQGNDASVRFDGGDSGITLTALRLDPTATISFEFNTDPSAGDGSPGWTAVPGTPTSVGEYRELVWTPDPALTGTEVAVRAVATAGGGVTYATRQGVAIARADWGTETVALSRTSSGSLNVGYFRQPYASTGRTAVRASVRGLTSASAGAVQVGWWDPATQSIQGKVDAAVEASDLKTMTPGTFIRGGGSFRADLDITAFSPGPGDAIALAGELDTDEVHLAALYEQTPATVVAFAPEVPAGPPTTVTISVEDSTTVDVAGVEVRRQSDGSLVGYTDGAGVLRDPQLFGSIDSYYVNTTDTDAYEAGTDLTATVATYVPSATTALPVLLDGRVFDDDEHAAGDLYFRVEDQSREGEPMPGASVSYRIYPTGTTPPATYQTAIANNQGRAPIAFAPQGPDGDYTVDYHLGADADKTVSFTAGDASLGLTPGSGAAAPGGEVTLKAALTVAGKPLPNRRVAAAYARGIELVPGQIADAALVNGATRVLSLLAETDPLGGFSVTVDDPAESSQAAETKGKLALSSIAASAGGISLAGNPNESASAAIAFGSAKGKAKVKLKGKSAGNKDKLVVKGPDSVAGEKVRFYRVVNGKLRAIKASKKSSKLNKSGDTVLKVTDSNANGLTTYVVKLVTSERVKGSKSKKLRLE